MDHHITNRLSLDRLFDVLAHPYRRLILDALANASRDDVLAISDLDLDTDDEAVRIELYHVHLPKLADAGCIELESATSFTRGPGFEQVAPVIELFDERRDVLPEDWP